MTVVIQYANAYFNLKNQDLRSNALVETKTGNISKLFKSKRPPLPHPIDNLEKSPSLWLSLDWVKICIVPTD